MIETAILVMALLGLKHFICDFPLQAFPYMYKNKGTYGHPGGLVHAGVHGIGTWMVMFWFTNPMTAIALAVFDMLVHYHVDWAKMNINHLYGLRPDNSEWFWIWLGIDQLAHFMTYIFIVWYLYC